MLFKFYHGYRSLIQIWKIKVIHNAPHCLPVALGPLWSLVHKCLWGTCWYQALPLPTLLPFLGKLSRVLEGSQLLLHQEAYSSAGPHLLVPSSPPQQVWEPKAG